MASPFFVRFILILAILDLSQIYNGSYLPYKEAYKNLHVCGCVCVCLFIDIDLKEVHDRVPREAMWCIIGTHTV